MIKRYCLNGFEFEVWSDHIVVEDMRDISDVTGFAKAWVREEDGSFEEFDHHNNVMIPVGSVPEDVADTFEEIMDVLEEL